MSEIVAKSYVGKLFTAEFSGKKNLTDALLLHVLNAGVLLDAAIRSLRADDQDFSCKGCGNAYEILGAYQDAIRIGLDRAEVEMMSRRKGKAA